MKKTALAIFYLFILSAAPVVATAGDWKLNGELSEKGDFNSNSTLAVFSPGWVFSPIETLNVDLAYLAHDSQFDLSGGVFARNFWGPGTSVTQDVLSPSVKARWQKFGPRTSLDMSASYSYEKVAFVDSLLLDTCLPITGSHLVDCGGDIVDPVRFLDRGARNSFGANFDLAQKLDARDTLSWSNAFAGKFTTTNLGMTAAETLKY